jgi:cytochrome c oxidase assembly factor CtaG
MGLLEYDHTLANTVQLVGALLFFWAMLRAFQYNTASEGAQKAALPQL